MTTAACLQRTKLTSRTKRLVARSPLFAGLGEANLDRMLAVSRERPMRVREQLMTAGDPGASAMVIMEGEVDVLLADGRGRDRVIGVLAAGAVVGEMSLFDGRPRSANVVARTNGRLLVIERDAVRRLIDADPGFALGVIDVLCGRLRDTLTQLDALQFKDVAARLAGALLARADGPAPRRVDITQSALGDVVGASREMVNKRLRTFAAEGLVCLRPGRVTLLDEAGLRHAAARVATQSC